MSRTVINNGASGLAVRNILNAHSKDQYTDAEVLRSLAGTGRSLIMCTTGCSHMTSYFTGVHQMALATVHDANIMYDARPVFVGEGDAVTTLVAADSRGRQYSVGQATPNHLVGAQLTQFLADVAAGFRADVMVSDFCFYNRNQSLALCIAKGWQMINAFFDPAGNNGLFFVVFGTWGTTAPSIIGSWNEYWRQVAKTSGGRIFFVDAAAAVMDLKLTTTTAGVYLNNLAANQFGSILRDGNHLSGYGQYRVAAQQLGAVYRAFCPATYPRTPGFANAAYDPANYPYADVLGPGRGMIGTNGADISASNGGIYPSSYYTGTIPGTAAQAGGVALWKDRWSLDYVASLAKPVPTITTSPDGGNEQTITLPNVTAVNGATLTYKYQPVIAIPDGGNPSWQYMAGIELEVINATGMHPPWMTLAGNTTAIPIQQGIHDGLPDGFSKIYRMRTLRPISLRDAAGNPLADPALVFMFSFRNVNVNGTIIKFRNPFFHRYGV